MLPIPLPAFHPANPPTEALVNASFGPPLATPIAAPSVAAIPPTAAPPTNLAGFIFFTEFFNCGNVFITLRFALLAYA